MQRREVSRRLKFSEHSIVYQAMLPKLGSAMDNPMSDGGRRRQFGLGEQSANAGDCLVVIRSSDCLGYRLIFAQILGVEFANLVAEFSLADQKRIGPRKPDTIQSEFK